MLIQDILKRATELASVSATPRLDIELLLCHVLQKDRSHLFAWPDKTLTDEQTRQVEILLAKRRQGEPVAYLTGSRDFWSLELLTEPSTLIPRPDTELLVEQALACCGHTPHTALDLGTGTGAIALALAAERPSWTVLGCDRIPEAVQLARKNALHNQLERVTFLQSSWFSAIPEQTFDLIVSNPPYIRDSDPHLAQGDVRFEPASALTSGPDGLDDIREISQQAPRWLNSDGYLILEHGYDQGADVRSILENHGFQNVVTVQDLSGHDRITRGQKPAL